MTQRPLGKIEIILDCGARSREMQHWVETVQQFFRKASAETGQEIQVTYLDTPQLFHEKTGYIGPDQAPARPEQWPESIRPIAQALRRGHYEVTERGPVDEAYRAALQDYVFTKQVKKDASVLYSQGVESPRDIPDDMLQQLFNDHVAGLKRGHPDRNKPAFKTYAAIRADSGERSVADFIEIRDVSETNGTVVTVFVTQDHGARSQVDKVARAKEVGGNEAVFAVDAQGAKALLSKIIAGYKTQHPETQAIQFNPESAQTPPTSRLTGAPLGR